MEDSNKISKEEVKHIAGLARIELSEEEVEKFASDLSDVLGYIKQLEEVETDNVEPVSQVTGKVNVFREDEVNEYSKEARDIISENYPDGQDGYIKVKQIL